MKKMASVLVFCLAAGAAFAADTAGNGTISDQNINFAHNNVMAGSLTVGGSLAVTGSITGPGVNSSLATGKVWIGNGSAVATAQTLSGDITVSSMGVVAAGGNAALLNGAQSFTALQTLTAGLKLTGAKNKATLKAYTPSAAGELWYCSDCSATTLAISTGTAAGGVSDIIGKTTAIN